MAFSTKRRQADQQQWIDAHTFSSERLQYRPPVRGDAAACIANLDAEVHRWQGWREDDARYDTRRVDRGFARPAIAWCAPQLLVCTDDGTVVGDYSVQPTSSATEVVLGWSLGPAGRGRGYGSESLVAMLGYFHRHVGAPRVRMGTDATNERALRQITGAGAVLDLEGDHELPNGSVVRSCWFVHDDPVVRRHLDEHGTWLPPCKHPTT